MDRSSNFIHNNKSRELRHQTVTAVCVIRSPWSLILNYVPAAGARLPSPLERPVRLGGQAI